jgi:hypothetical protein
MNNRAITIADIDAAIAAENQRHSAKMAELATTRRVLIDFLGEAEKSRGGVAFDPHEYGGKKKLLLRLIAAEKEGLSSMDLVAAANKAGLRDAKLENVVPQLSLYKSDGLLILIGANWRITDNGREYLAAKN